MLPEPAVIRTEKRCSRCKEIKPIDEFGICRTHADWRNTNCKPCNVAGSAEWRKKNPERARQNSYAQYLRDREKPDDQRLKYTRRYFQNNKELQAKRTQLWKDKNRAHFNAYMLRYHKAKMQRDPNYRFSVKVRTSIRLLMRGYQKSGTAEQLLGCKILDFKKYLELQWEPWMSWANYGNREGFWVIDHIVPVNAFDFSKPEDQRCCFHFSNLRPFCCVKNRQKSDTFNPADLDALRKRVLCLNESSLPLLTV